MMTLAWFIFSVSLCLIAIGVSFILSSREPPSPKKHEEKEDPNRKYGSVKLTTTVITRKRKPKPQEKDDVL